MPVVPIGEYRPDVSDYEGTTERDVLNVVPRGDGYGPFPSLTALSQSLGAQCRGAFEAINFDGSFTVFAATATDLYVLNNTTLVWSRVSLGGTSYAGIPGADQWWFKQFNSLVICGQANVVPQVWTLQSSSAFANLAGSPPQARYADVVGPFLVLGGLLNNPNRIQWSGLNEVNDANAWTPGLNSGDFQDFPDCGFVRGIAGIAGGINGVILQDTGVRTLTYLPGDPRVFQITKIADGLGIYAPLSLVRSGATLFFYSLKGFQRIDPGGVPVQIGRERVDRTFFGNLDVNNLQMFQGIADPRSSRVIWVYKSVNGAVNQFDSALCYDMTLDKFTPLQIQGEYLFQMGQPGVTLEGLDILAPNEMAVVGAANNGSGLIRVQVASTANLAAPVSVILPGIGTVNAVYLSLESIGGTTEANGNWFVSVIDGTHFDLLWNINTQATSAFVHAYTSGGIVAGQVDAMTQSLDNFSIGSQPELAAFDQSHILNFFRGPSLQAVLETSEQGTDGKRIKLKRGFRPITDAPVVYGSASQRETQAAAVVAGNESLINSTTGICNMLVDTRYSRFKCRIPAGTSWSFINGVEPVDLATTGRR